MAFLLILTITRCFPRCQRAATLFEWYQKFFSIDQKEFEQDCRKLYQRYLLNQISLKDPVILIPHLNGSGAPFKSGKSRGLMYGISLETRREDVLLGIILGLCLE